MSIGACTVLIRARERPVTPDKLRFALSFAAKGDDGRFPGTLVVSVPPAMARHFVRRFRLRVGRRGCGGGQPATRGFGSTELLSRSGLDAGPRGRKQPRRGHLWDGGPGGGVPRSANYSTLNLSTGAVQNYGSEFPPYPSSSPPPPPSPYNCTLVFSDANNTYTLQIVDSSTGAETDVATSSHGAMAPPWPSVPAQTAR